MRSGYWLPVFGGWLRNVPDEGMAPTWDYVRRLAQRSEQIGDDLTRRTASRRNSSVYAVRPRFFFMTHLLPRISIKAVEVSTNPGEVHYAVFG